MNIWYDLLDQTAIIPILVLIWVNKNSPYRVYYKPFIYLLFIKEIAEIISFILIKEYHKTNAPVYNVLYFAEAFLLLIQFLQWKVFIERIKIFYFLFSMFMVVWLFDTFYIGSFLTFNLYFRITYCTVLTLLAIYQINSLTVSSKIPLYKNSIAIICIGIIILFINNMIFEFIYKLGLDSAYYAQVSLKVLNLITFINAAVNLLFAWSIYNLPKLKNFNIP